MKSKTRKAVYAASLDPITNGHINVATRMASRYDKLTVVVAVDPRKHYFFNHEERVSMAKAALAHLPNVTVDACVGQYVVKFAKSLGADVVIRGLRNASDLDSEFTLAEENRQICPDIETILVPCLPSLMYVSSSLVRSHVGTDPDWEAQVARLAPASVVAKLKEKYILGKARTHWSALMSALGNPKESEKVFADLVTRYSEVHRGYHTPSHIVAMLDDLETAKPTETGSWEYVAFATWFHDAVYDPLRGDNEERSAMLAKAATERLGLPKPGPMEDRRPFGDVVSDLIMVTKHTVRPETELGKLIVDLDLANFGKSLKEFEAVGAGIRKEYCFVPEDKFRAGRAKILSGFLNRRPLYLTEFFRNKYQKSARKNLRHAIGLLSK